VTFGAKRKLNTDRKKIGVTSGANRKLNTREKKIGVTQAKAIALHLF
jgi:hypothetical protein